MQDDDVGELLGGVGAHFEIGRRAFLDIAEIDHGFDFDGALFELLGQFDDHALHQGGAADRLLHAQLAAFHAARQSTSPSRVSSGTAPISRRYTRTGSSV